MRHLEAISIFGDTLGLPDDMKHRDTSSALSAKVARVLELKSAQPRRTFLLGVLIAYIGVAEELTTQVAKDSIEHVFESYPGGTSADLIADLLQCN
jgi:hypothetical protein